MVKILQVISEIQVMHNSLKMKWISIGWDRKYQRMYMQEVLCHEIYACVCVFVCVFWVMV